MKGKQAISKHGTHEPVAMTTAAAARRLGVTAPTIRAEIKSGALRAIKVGGHFRVLVSDLEKYVSEHENRAA